jgi:hypothetical protein
MLKAYSPFTIVIITTNGATGKPNIRRAFIEQSSSLSATQQYVLPAHARRISIPRCPHLCSYGHVLRLPLSDDKKLQDILGRGRIRMVQTVEVTVSQNPGRMGKVPAIIYYDPRNTCDLRHSIVKTDAERIAWNNGLNLLRFAGAPYWYTQKVTKHLNAFMEDVEPLLVCPVQLAVQPLDLRDAEADDESVVLEGRNASGSNRRGSESLPMRGARNGRLEAAGLTLPTVRNVKRARNPCGDEGRAQPRKRLRKLSIGSTSRRPSGT